MDAVREESRAFFALSMEEKESMSIRNSASFRGYQRYGDNVTGGMHDRHEGVDFFCELPAGHPHHGHRLNQGLNQWPNPAVLPRYRPALEAYTTHVMALGNAVMRGVALGLGLPVRYFEPLYSDSFWVMRSIYYPAANTRHEVDDTLGAGFGCGEHTDYGCLTIVNQDDIPGTLEARNTAGEWVAADVIEGAFVMNIGDMLKVWTNGMYQSTPHRVRQAPCDRISVPFFFEPNIDTMVSPLEVCCTQQGESPQFASVMYGDHLEAKSNNNFKL